MTATDGFRGAGNYVSRSYQRLSVKTWLKAKSMHVTPEVQRKGICFHLVEQNGKGRDSVHKIF